MWLHIVNAQTCVKISVRALRGECENVCKEETGNDTGTVNAPTRVNVCGMRGDLNEDAPM